MDFQRNMWAEAWLQSAAAYKFVALAVFGELAIQSAVEWFAVNPNIKFVTSTLLWSCLAYIIHAQILLPDVRLNSKNSVRLLGFAVRAIGISVMVSVIGLITAIVATRFQVYSLNVQFLVFVFLVLPPFIWLSTILPAYVADRARGVRAAFGRGSADFIWIAGRLLVGPILLAKLSASLYLWLAFHLRSSRRGDYNGPLWDKDWVFQPTELPLMFAHYTIQAFVVVLTAVILSRAFLRAEGMPDTVPS